MTRALTGFALAVLIGTVVGAAVSRFAPLRAAIGSLITGLQTMPSIMWFPLAILLFQISESAIMFVVIIGAAPVGGERRSAASTTCRGPGCGSARCWA